MKKILIPIIGLLVLIFLTPIILGKMANSNIDKKIENLKTSGVKIKELKKEIGYLNSNREFEVILDKHTKNKTWQKYPFLKRVKFIVDLKFKNLPITKADMDIEVKYLKLNDSRNYSYLKGLSFNVVTKDFKHFEYKITKPPKNFNIKLVGVAENKKYLKIALNSEIFNYDSYIKTEDNKLDLIIKSFELGLVEAKWTGKKWSFQKGKIVLKGEDSNETFSSHLNPDKKYYCEDIFYSKKLALQVKDIYFAFADFNWNLKIKDFTKDSFNNSNIILNIDWKQTEYKKTIVDGGRIALNVKILNQELKKWSDIEVDLDILLSESLFKRITTDLDPAMVKKIFKNNKSHIEIKNGVITANGNRI